MNVSEMKRTRITYSKEEFLLSLFNRHDAYGFYAKKGNAFKCDGVVNKNLIHRHIKNKITIGTYGSSKQSTSKWICFDIDAHDKSDTTPEELIELQQLADYEDAMLRHYLDCIGIPYVHEKSVSYHSYHTWIIVDAVDSQTAKDFGDYICKNIGLDCEVFPRQGKISKNLPYGNYVKLPCAKHHRTRNESKLRINGEYLHDFDEIIVESIDISWFETPPVHTCEPQKRVRKRGKSNGTFRKSAIRPCVEAAVLQPLHGRGAEGHWMRCCIVREYHNAGLSVHEIAKLFSKQVDYDYDHTVEKIHSIICVEFRTWSRKRMLETCAVFMNCDECDDMKCKLYK